MEEQYIEIDVHEIYNEIEKMLLDKYELILKSENNIGNQNK